VLFSSIFGETKQNGEKLTFRQSFNC